MKGGVSEGLTAKREGGDTNSTRPSDPHLNEKADSSYLKNAKHKAPKPLGSASNTSLIGVSAGGSKEKFQKKGVKTGGT